jgi:hypothetical protein
VGYPQGEATPGAHDLRRNFVVPEGTASGNYDMVVKVGRIKDSKVYDVSQKTVSVQVTAP